MSYNIQILIIIIVTTWKIGTKSVLTNFTTCCHDLKSGEITKKYWFKNVTSEEVQVSAVTQFNTVSVWEWCRLVVEARVNMARQRPSSLHNNNVSRFYPNKRRWVHELEARLKKIVNNRWRFGTFFVLMDDCFYKSHPTLAKLPQKPVNAAIVKKNLN